MEVIHVADDKTRVRITAKREIHKYAEGAIPGVDAPFEILIKEDVFEGEDAEKILKQIGGTENGSN